MNDNIKKTIEAIAVPLAESLGLNVWGLEISGAGRPIVRIYVEGENGCNIDDCAELSHLLGLSLDVEDVMPGAYALEVSSPGLERTFFSPEQLIKYIGEIVNLTLADPLPKWPGRKKFQGKLLTVAGNDITLRLDDAPKPVPDEIKDDGQDNTLDNALLTTCWQNIQKVRLVHNFNANKGVKRGAL